MSDKESYKNLRWEVIAYCRQIEAILDDPTGLDLTTATSDIFAKIGQRAEFYHSCWKFYEKDERREIKKAFDELWVIFRRLNDTSWAQQRQRALELAEIACPVCRPVFESIASDICALITCDYSDEEAGAICTSIAQKMAIVSKGSCVKKNPTPQPETN